MRVSLAAAIVFFLWLAAPAGARSEERPLYEAPASWVREIEPPEALESARDEPLDFILRDVQVRVEDDAVAEYRRQVVRINSATGLQFAGSIAFVWNPASDALTIHRLDIRRGGETIDALRGGGAVSVLRREQNLDRAMLDGMLTAAIQPAGLQVGDILDVAITIERRDPTLDGRAEHFSMLTDFPAQRLRFRADWPRERQVRWRAAEGVDQPRVSTSGGRQVISLDVRNVTATPVPEGAPARFYERGYIELSEHASFEAVSALLAPHFEAASTFGADSGLAAEVARIEAAAPDARSRALLALRLVEDQVRYFYVGLGQGGYVPASADETWRRRFGDCKAKSALLIALLRRLGIEAVPALASIRRNDGLETRLPMLQSFDHVIVRAVIDGEAVWLDPTRAGDRALATASPIGLRWALPVTAPGSAIMAIPDPESIPPQTITSFEIDASAGLFSPARARAQMRLTAPTATMARMNYESLPAAQRDQFLRLTWTQAWGWIEIEQINFRFDEESGEAVISVEGAADLSARDIGMGASATLPITAPFAIYLGGERSGSPSEPPIVVQHPVASEGRLNIRLPPGAVFQFEGEAWTRRVGPFEFARSFAINGEEAVVDLRYRTLGGEVAATEARAVESELNALFRQSLRLVAARYNHTEADLAALGARGSGNAQLERGIALLSRGDVDGARAAFDAMLEQNPEDAWALANRGMAHLWRHDVEAAETDFERALTLDPSNYVAYQGRGVLLYERGEHRAAVEAFSTALRLNANPFARVGRARSYTELGDHARALEDYRALLNEAGMRVEIRAAIAESLLELGREDEARAELEAISVGDERGSPEWENAVMLRSQIAARIGWFDKAIEDANTLVEASSAPVPVLAHRCRILAAANRDLDRALRDCNESLSMDDDYAEGLISRGLVHLRRGDFAAAIRDYSAALGHRPGVAEAHFGRALAYAGAGDRARAEADWAAARAISPTAGDYFETLGLAADAVPESP